MSTLKRRERNSHVFISFLMMIFWKFFHKLKSQLQSSLIWRRSLKISILLSSITKKWLQQCSQQRNKKSISWRKWTPMRKTSKIGWMKYNVWWCNLLDTNSRTQLINIPQQKEQSGHAIIQANAFSMVLKYGGRLSSKKQ